MDSTNPGSTPELTLLDYHQLETFIVIGIDDYHELLGDVTLEAPEHLRQIKVAIQQGDAATIKTRAHGLRGLLAYFGCVAVTKRLAQLETQEIVPPEQADSTHAELLDLWEQSLAALAEWEKSVPDFGP
jgi:HPt (histidine-containing phosphotransfer) domain-containing protein